jgi:hypothetical protein
MDTEDSVGSTVQLVGGGRRGRRGGVYTQGKRVVEALQGPPDLHPLPCAGSVLSRIAYLCAVVVGGVVCEVRVCDCVRHYPRV